MERFEGKRILLTGGASGIGRATAIRLASEGGLVYAVDRNEEGLAETAAQAPGRIITRATDVSAEADVVSAVAAARGEMGGIDVLVNVAGLHRVTPLEELTVADFQKLLDINLLGTFLFCREAMPALREAKGVVVNTASTSATHAHPYMTAYAATKGGVLAFSLSLAAEVAPDVRVVAVSPGGVATPLTAGVHFPDPAQQIWYGRITPQIGTQVNEYVRFGRPESIAATIAYAASADAEYLTGVELRVDGGSHT